ncbi:glycosyl transferase family 2 [archaeon]|nr:glycosyl transferase family 2 [archaeon]|tara:strand:+ start:200 stop:1162 length:963 start_codon:yes stop_codon:yes gene_type:complete
MRNKKIVVIIPALNEENTLGFVIRDIKKIVKDAEIIVVNDGSRDNTVNVALEAGATKVISHKRNKGLGVAFKTGINNALKIGADIIVSIDADGQFNPEDIPRLIQPILDEKSDMVTCSRFLHKKYLPKMPLIKRFGNKLFTKLVNIITRRRYTDTQCGFRAYSRKAALSMTLFGEYTYTQEVFIDLISRGFRIIEVPCEVKGQRKGKSKLINNVFSYGVKALLIILRTMRDYQPLKFFGFIGLVVFLVGFTSSLVLSIRWLIIHQIYPYMFLVYINVILLFFGFLLIILAFLADMFDRQRKLQEEILFRLKKEEFNGANK